MATEKKCSRCGRPFKVANSKSRARVCSRCQRAKANASARARRSGGGKRSAYAIRFRLGGGGLSGGADVATAGGPFAVNSDFYKEEAAR